MNIFTWCPDLVARIASCGNFSVRIEINLYLQRKLQRNDYTIDNMLLPVTPGITLRT